MASPTVSADALRGTADRPQEPLRSALADPARPSMKSGCANFTRSAHFRPS